MASGRLLSKSALAKRFLAGGLRPAAADLLQQPQQIPRRYLHGIPSPSPISRSSSSGGKYLMPPRRNLHLNEHSFHELAVDYGFTEFEPLYKVLRFIVVYRFIAEVFL